MAVSIEKVERQAPQLVSLVKKAQVALDKSRVGGTPAKVALVLDYSGSMRSEYRNGSMQRLAEKVLSLGVNLDDDGAIDLFIFDSGATYLGEITLADYQGSIDRLTSNRRMGTTNYAAAFRAVRDHFFPKAPIHKPAEKRGLFGLRKATPAPVAATAEVTDTPVYALFLTDGSPDNKAEAVAAITEVSNSPIFWKFLSIGSENIQFLQKLDDLDDRFVDNADYKPIPSVDRVSDEDLFEKMLDEYPGWLNEVRKLGILR